jgi:hypothetical protein
LIGVHPMTISRWERDELRVGPWHRQLLIALVSAQPRDNLEQRLSETSSNPVRLRGQEKFGQVARRKHDLHLGRNQPALPPIG